jgi:hypothetical protein
MVQCTPSHDHIPGVWCAVNTNPISFHEQLIQNGVSTRIQSGFHRLLALDEEIISKQNCSLMSRRSDCNTET